MSRKTTLTSRPPAGRRRDAHGFLRDGPPHRHPWSHYGTELAVVEAYTASERKVRLAHAALNASGPHVRPQHPPRKGSREWLQTYIKIPEDADVRDVQSHLRTASLHVKSEPVPERPVVEKKPTWPFSTPPSGIGLSLLYCSVEDVCAVCASGKGWLDALETYGLKRVGFWAPLSHETAPSYCRSMERLRETRTVNSVRDCVGRGSASHISVVINRGRVITCGKNDGGQRGDATIGQGPGGWPTSSEVHHLEPSVVVAVAVGGEHTAFLDSDGCLLECGRDGSREGSKDAQGDRRPCRFRPERILLRRRVLQVSAGDDFTIIITTKGELWGWGRGDFGELGSGMRVQRDPGPCECTERFAQVSAGPRHVLASTNNGRLYAWGYGEDGATGLDETAWRPRRVELVQGVVSDLSAGAAHSLVVVRGAVHALGTTLNGRAGVPCGNPPVERAVFDCVRGLPNDVVRVAAGGEHSLCLTASGEVYAWGRGGRAGQRSPRDVFACVVLWRLCWIVTSTCTPSTRRLLDDTLVDFHTGLGADVGAIRSKGRGRRRARGPFGGRDGGRDLPDVWERRPRAARVPRPVQAGGPARQGFAGGDGAARGAQAAPEAARVLRGDGAEVCIAYIFYIY